VLAAVLPRRPSESSMVRATASDIACGNTPFTCARRRASSIRIAPFQCRISLPARPPHSSCRISLATLFDARARGCSSPSLPVIKNLLRLLVALACYMTASPCICARRQLDCGREQDDDSMTSDHSHLVDILAASTAGTPILDFCTPRPEETAIPIARAATYQRWTLQS
jgi:hypothetical protein